LDETNVRSQALSFLRDLKLDDSQCLETFRSGLPEEDIRLNFGFALIPFFKLTH
jgi:hypothetical protein